MSLKVASIVVAVLAVHGGAVGALAAPVIPVTHWQGSVSLDPATSRFRAEAEAVLADVPEAGAPWRFLLSRELHVRSVLVDERPLPLTEIDGWNPRHFWERPPYADLGGYEVAREYEVAAPLGGWGSTPPRISLRWEGVIADSLHAPDRAYGRGFETTSGRIVPEGAYLSGSTFWLPWAGEGDFTFQFAIESPVEWSSIAPGDFEGRQESGGKAVMHWISRDPIEDVPLVSGPYVIRRREHKGVSVETWCYADTPDEVTDPYLDAGVEAIDRFSREFGRYPYSKCALVENYWQTGWGMPSFTLLGDRVIRLPFIVYTSFPHEILHNWWGNGVYVDATRGNWCEGLTTFGADYAAKEAESPEAARDYRRNQLVGYRDFATEGGRDFPLSKFRERDSAATQAVGYGKTLMLFHMLRNKVGPEVFSASLKRFYRENLFRAATWDDLRAAFSTQTGDDFAPWFTQWIDLVGAPALSLEDVVSGSVGEQWIVRGTLVQVGSWQLDVPVLVKGANASERVAVTLVGERTPFEIRTGFAPLVVAADPGFELLRHLHAAEVASTLSGVLGAGDTRIVIGAEAEGDVRAALLALGNEWAGDEGISVVEEASGEPLPGGEGGTWYFGEGPAARAFVASLPEPPAEGTLVLSGRIGGADGQPAGALLPTDAESVASIGRKIPHYSKYSWLAFDGNTNVGKGVWEAGESPLTVHLEPRS